MTAIARFALAALDCPDPAALAGFYSSITGWPVGKAHEEDWIELDSGDGVTIAFQLSPNHRPPVWPSDEHPQQLHLDFDVSDLDDAERRVLAIGARKAEFQPEPESFRVYLDPAGHPFCFVLEH